jgi:hypothetical protein
MVFEDYLIQELKDQELYLDKDDIDDNSISYSNDIDYTTQE